MTYTKATDNKQTLKLDLDLNDALGLAFCIEEVVGGVIDDIETGKLSVGSNHVGSVLRLVVHATRNLAGYLELLQANAPLERTCRHE